MPNPLRQAISKTKFYLECALDPLSESRDDDGVYNGIQDALEMLQTGSIKMAPDLFDTASSTCQLLKQAVTQDSTEMRECVIDTVNRLESVLQKINVPVTPVQPMSALSLDLRTQRLSLWLYDRPTNHWDLQLINLALDEVISICRSHPLAAGFAGEENPNAFLWEGIIRPDIVWAGEKLETLINYMGNVFESP